MAIRIQFSRWQRYMMYFFSEQRHKFARKNGIQDRQGTKDYTGAEVDYIGLLGEAAACEVLGGHLDLSLGKDGGCDVLGLPDTYQVKTPMSPNLNFCCASRSPLAEDYGVLVLPPAVLTSNVNVFAVTALDVVGFIDLSAYHKHKVGRLNSEGEPLDVVFKNKFRDIEEWVFNHC